MSNERPTTHPRPEPPQPPSVPTPNTPPLERGEATGGAMTGETGVLTPEVEQEELVTGERREIEDPGHAGQAALKRHAAASGSSSAMGPGAPGSLAGPLATERASGLTGKMAEGAMGGSVTPAAGTEAGIGRSPLGTYEGGYGGEHGLAPDDPAYREEPVRPDDDPRRG
jgi:hypothetical protein